MIKIRHSQFDAIASVHLLKRTPMFIWSPPGCGKTEHLAQICESLGFDLIDWRLAQMDAVDVRGIPFRTNDGRTDYAPPLSLPEEGCGPTVLFLDELMQAHPSVVAVAGQLINERRLGDYHLPDNVVIVGASNRHTDRSAANKMPAHTANRFSHYELTVGAEEWAEWAIQNNIDERVIAFVRFRPELVYQFDPKSDEVAYPTLRSWTRLSSLIDGVDDSALLHPLAVATVGGGAGAEFVAFCTALDDLPDLDALIANPADHVDPQRADLRYAITTALSRRADDANVESIWAFLLKLPAEYQVLWAKYVRSLNQFDFLSTGVYLDVIAIHRDILIN